MNIDTLLFSRIILHYNLSNNFRKYFDIFIGFLRDQAIANNIIYYKLICLMICLVHIEIIVQ